MKLYNQNENIKINDMIIERLFFNNPTNRRSYSYHSSLIGDNIHLNVAHENILVFEGVNTFDNSSSPYRVSDILIFNTSDVNQTQKLSKENLIEYHMTNVQNYMKSYEIKGDLDKNTYHYGFSYGVINSQSKIDFGIPSATTENVSTISKTKYYQGYLYKINSDYQITTALSFMSNDIYNNLDKKCVVSDYLNIDGKNFVNIFADSKYYYKFNDDSWSQIMDDSYCNYSTHSVVKFDENFSNVEWYKKYFAKSITSQYKNMEIIDSYPSKSANMMVDTENQNIYFSLNYTFSTYKIYSYDGVRENLISTVDRHKKSVLLTKIKSLDGSLVWSKPIYNAENSKIFIKKMEYIDNCIYILLQSKGGFIFENETYSMVSGENENWILKLDKNANFLWTKFIDSYNNGEYSNISDMVVYQNDSEKFLYVSGYFENSKNILGYELISSSTGSYLIKVSDDGEILGLLDKISYDRNGTESLCVISSLSIVNDSVYISGYYCGEMYIGGNKNRHLRFSDRHQFFIEEIKINSF